MLAAAGQNQGEEMRFSPAPTVGDVANVGEYTKVCMFVYPAVVASESVIPRLLEITTVLPVGLPDELLPAELMQKLFCE